MTTIASTLPDAKLKGHLRLKKITVFHCANALKNGSTLEKSDVVFRIIRLPCSGMIREVHLLRAFEDGADAVLLLACPEGQCRYLEGNIRAKKRVARIKQLLDEIGLNGSRLNICNIPGQDENVIRSVIDRTVAELDTLGPNPAV